MRRRHRRPARLRRLYRDHPGRGNDRVVMATDGRAIINPATESTGSRCRRESLGRPSCSPACPGQRLRSPVLHRQQRSHRQAYGDGNEITIVGALGGSATPTIEFGDGSTWDTAARSSVRSPTSRATATTSSAEARSRTSSSAAPGTTGSSETAATTPISSRSGTAGAASTTAAAPIFSRSAAIRPTRCGCRAPPPAATSWS